MNKSFLKWAGGKFDLVPTLLPLILESLGKGGRYIEPFVGGGAVALNIPLHVPKMLNDINPGVVEVWTSLKRDPEAFIVYAASFFQSGFYNTEARYYKQRDAFNFAVKHGGGDVTAALFLYLNRHCFNGLCRFNKSGEFNVPYGRYRTVYYPEKELRHAGVIMQNATISSLDFVDIMNMAIEGDVVYCDPPYVPISATSSFVGYSTGGFTLEQQWSLVARAERLRDRGVTVIISNNDTALSRKMYKNADEVKKVLVSKRISCKADGRKKQGELIAIYKP